MARVHEENGQKTIILTRNEIQEILDTSITVGEAELKLYCLMVKHGVPSYGFHSMEKSGVKTFTGGHLLRFRGPGWNGSFLADDFEVFEILSGTMVSCECIQPKAGFSGRRQQADDLQKAPPAKATG